MTTKSHPQENVFVTVFRLKDQKNLKIHGIKKLRMRIQTIYINYKSMFPYWHNRVD
jgi:hypothetical protein